MGIWVVDDVVWGLLLGIIVDVGWLLSEVGLEVFVECDIGSLFGGEL